eukprot:6401338-Amphidinium_carterae.1
MECNQELNIFLPPYERQRFQPMPAMAGFAPPESVTLRYAHRTQGRLLENQEKVWPSSCVSAAHKVYL